MKRRRREVNIFNVSLLDILCGALGAFCFLMIVLLPYWRPTGVAARDIEEQYQRTQRELEDLRRKISQLPNASPDLARQLEKLLEDFRKRQRQLTDALNKLEQARRDLKKEEERNNRLEMRRPLVASLQWTSPSHDVDLYLRSRARDSKGNTQAPVDATKKQSIYFNGDLYTNCSRGPCIETWMIRDFPKGSEIEVHYKFFAANGNSGPARIGPVSINHEGGFFVLPRATLAAEKTSTLVGVAKLGGDLKLTFQPEPEYAGQFNQSNKQK